MSTTRKSIKVWIARSAMATVAAAVLVLAPFAALAPDLRSLGEVGPFAEAASFVNTTVPSNANLTSGLQLFYSFDNTKVTGSTITDESGNGKTGTPSAGYQFFRSVTIDHTKVPNTDQTNFPVLFSGTYAYLKTTANGGNVTSASGYDIIFTSDSACATKLDHEIETYTASTGAVNLWVRVPTVSHTTDTVLYLCYGNSAITTSQENKTGVWDTNYKGVWHLPNGSTLTANDSTGAVNLTNNGTTPATSGKVDGAASFNGSSQYLRADATPSTAVDNWTLEAWVNPSALPQDGVSSAVLALYNGTDSGGYGFGVGDGTGLSGSKLQGLYGTVVWIDSGYTFGSTNTWYHVAAIRSSGTLHFYVNGSVTSGNSTATPLSVPAHFTIGNELNSSNSPYRYFSGKVDEARISSSARSADWITTEYNNQNSPSTFYTLGAPTVGSPVLRVPGRIGQAISFNGITASTTVGSVSSTVESVAFWAKVATSTAQQNIIDLNGSGANIEIVSGTVTANGFTSPTIYVDGAVTSTLNDRNWHHVVVTTGTNVNASNVNLGVVGGTYYGGSLDDLRLYNRALSASEVTRLYHLGATSYINTTVPSNANLTNGLQLFYSFDNTKVTGTSITDESGNGKTGTPSTGYQFFRTVTIDHTKVPNTDQSNFPVLFSGTYAYLKTTANGGNVTNASGYDIIFSSSSSCATKLDHEIETYTATTGAVNLWVRVPTVSHTTDTVLYLCYGNSAITTSQENKTGVWDSNFKGVWHLPNGSTLTAKNSITAVNGTITGAVAATGEIDGGASFANTGDRIVTDYANSGPTTKTYSIWAYRTGDGGGGFGRMFDNQPSSAPFYDQFLETETNDYAFVQVYTGVNGKWSIAKPSLNAWHYITVTYDDSSVSNNPLMYVDGASVTVTTVTAPTQTTAYPTSNFQIGNRDSTAAPDRVWNGTLDEFRVSDVIRSADWITTEYNNQNSPGTFYTLGTATAGGAVLRVPGRIGQAISFNGITASTTVGNVSSTIKSVAFWAKAATSTAQQNIIDLNGSGANIEIVSGTVTANGFTSPTIYVDGTVSSTLNDRNWHHVVVTTGTNVNASNVNLGVVGGTYYGGSLDDLRLYNRALSASEVTRLYHLGATSYVNTTVPSNANLTSGLQLFYSFDNTKVNIKTGVIIDESGSGKNGTYKKSGNTNATTTQGRIGQAISFNGITASTTVGNVSSTVESVAFWAKVATSTAQQNIIDLNGSGANIEIVSGTVTANGFTSPAIYVDGAVSSTLNDRNWHHVVVTTGTNVNASNVNLGVVGGTYYGGSLDDLRLYNRALSASEVTRLYHLGS